MPQLQNIEHFCKDEERHLHNPILPNRCSFQQKNQETFLFYQAQRALREQECLGGKLF